MTPSFADEHLKAHENATLYDELHTFGELMLDEVTARTEALDSKANSILGWTSGLLALFVWSPPAQGSSWLESIAALIGAGGALVALIESALALRVRQWEWPSQQDWFHTDVFDDVLCLHRLHLLAMLEAHEARCGGNEKKAHALKIAQVGLVLAGLALVAQLLVHAAIRRFWP